MRSILDVCCVADRNSGSFICPLYNVEAKAIVDGNMAEVTLIQNFVNTGRKSIEALYTFPLIHNAQITGFKAQIGENQVVGAFKEKEEAFRDYNDAISKGDSAFLFESHRPDIFQISLGNIAVGERVTISITYLEEIKIVDNELRWIFPTVLAPRYIPGRVLGKKTGAGTVLPTDRVPDADYIILPVGEGYFTLKMTITVKRMEGIKKISSPSHPIEISIEKNSYLITFAREMELLDSDFVLSLLVEDIQRNSYIIGTRDILISAKYSTSDSTFMEVVDEHHDMEASMDGRSDSCENTVSTNNSNSSEHVNSINNIDTGADTGTDEKENLPDNSKKNADEVFGEIKLVMDVDWYEQEYNNYQYIFMIDVSGSMAGEKLEQAKRALKIALRNLVEGDQFNIIAFESTYQYFSESPEDYSQESLMRADEWIGKLQSMGGTEIYKPLNFILQKFNDDADYRSNPGKVIYLFTDGQVGNEKEVIRLVSQYSHLISLYPFGIDTAVNKYFIDSLAEIGNGMPEYIYPGERIEEKVIRQFSRMHQPYMENPQITGKEGSYLEAMPPLPKRLYNSEFYNFVIRAEKLDILEEITISGDIKGKRIDIVLKASGKGDFRLMSLKWAKEKIKCMEAQLDMGNLRRDELTRKEIINLSTKYKLLSTLTSLVAIYKRNDKQTGFPETVVIPVSKPRGWDMFNRLSHSQCYRSASLIFLNETNAPMYNQEEESGITIPQFFRTDSAIRTDSTSKRAKKAKTIEAKNSCSETNFYNKYNDKYNDKHDNKYDDSDEKFNDASFVIHEERINHEYSDNIDKISGLILKTAEKQNADGSFGHDKEVIRKTSFYIIGMLLLKGKWKPYRIQIMKAGKALLATGTTSENDKEYKNIKEFDMRINTLLKAAAFSMIKKTKMYEHLDKKEIQEYLDEITANLHYEEISILKEFETGNLQPMIDYIRYRVVSNFEYKCLDNVNIKEFAELLLSEVL